MPRSKEKGNQFERLIEKKLQDALGKPFARRTDKGRGDIEIYLDDCTYLVECKNDKSITLEVAFQQSCEWADEIALKYPEQIIPIAVKRRKPGSRFIDVMLWLSDLCWPNDPPQIAKEMKVTISFGDFVNYILWRKNLRAEK